MEWKQFGEALMPKAVETALDSAKESQDLNANHSILEAKMKTLLATRDDLKDRATKYTSTMKRTMDDWFQRVNNVKEHAQKLKSCFLALEDTSAWIHLRPRSKLSRKMSSLCLEIDQLVTESNQLWDTLVHKAADRVLKMTAPDTSYIPSQENALKQILEHLQDEDYRAIRVLGMSGSGKTTTLKNLNNHKTVSHMFERVIWVTVSDEEKHKENLSIRKLQHVISERLMVDTEGTTDIERVARKIKEELEGVKFLLLLDDVKEELDLDMIGIPEGAKGTKLVMTTKYRHVTLPLCCNIEVKKLSSNDSWTMFHKLLDFPNDNKEKPQLDRIARKALEICDGLPLMIKMAASVFKTIEKHERNEISWSDGLQTFKRWPEKRENNIMGNLLKFCCDHLDLEQKPCFLYSALHPEDTEICIEGLLECWAAENFLKSGDNAKFVGRNILRHLKNVILLEDGAIGQFVRMHKVIRAIALNILSEEFKDKCLVRTSEALQTPFVPKRQCVDLWTDKEWISLANDSLNISPYAPHSSKLTTLFVQNYSKHKHIPDSFFQHMNCLLVLNLYKTEIMTLPLSILQLSNLKVLYLNGCRLLKEIPSLIGELKALEVLDIRGSGVCKLPYQIEGLTRLRRLLVSFTISTIDNHDVIFKLSGLEELIVEVDPQVKECSKLIEDLVEKVSTLRGVFAFQICLLDKVIDVIQVVDDTVKIFMPTEHHLSSFLERRQDDLDTHSFQVFIGCLVSHDIEIPEFSRYDRYVKYYNGRRGYNDVINKVLNKVEAFELINHDYIEHLSSSAVESMNHIKGCLIKSCNNMRAIVVDDGTLHNSLLPNMERLDAKNLPNLESIWEGHVHFRSLSKLKTLVIVKCPKLTFVFSNAIVHQLSELEYLEIQDCCRVEEIVMRSQDVSLFVIPKLKTLILCKLPSLRKICTTLVWNSLTTLKIHDCPKLKEFPFNNNNARTLQKIEIEKKWWEELRWPDSELKEQLESHCFFRRLA